MPPAGLQRGEAIRQVLQERNYRLLLAGQVVALLGEQINLIALPWLALQLTGDAVALGSVLAVRGLPPALLTLAGGVTTDRFSPRTVLLAADALRFELAAILVVALLTGSVPLWLLYPVALMFGLLSAFAQPAAGSIFPVIVRGPNLQTANSLFQSLIQFAAFAGPALAGILISGAPATVSTPTQIMPTAGIALAFGLYAVGLAVSVSTLSGCACRRARPPLPPQVLSSPSSLWPLAFATRRKTGCCACSSSSSWPSISCSSAR